MIPSKKKNLKILKNNIFIGGSFENLNTIIIEDIRTSNLVLYKDYIRKSKSILDCYANIFSLWISLYNFFTFLFLKLYSKSFNKYKIIENILSRQKENLLLNNESRFHEKKIKENNKGDILLEDSFEKENNDDQMLINDRNTTKEKEIFDLEEKNNFVGKNNEQERILPKLSFLDFFKYTLNIKICDIHKRNNLYGLAMKLCIDIILLKIFYII